MEKQMENKQYYHFKKEQTEANVSSKAEHLYICEEDAQWDDVMRQFAAFLDASGYVGVYERIDNMLDNMREDEWEFFLEQTAGVGDCGVLATESRGC